MMHSISPRRALLPILLLMAGCSIVYAQGGPEFERLLAQGKENMIRSEKNSRDPESDTAAVREGYRRAMTALEGAVALYDSSQEAHYFLGYAYDRYLSPFSSGEHLRETRLETVEKVSRQMERVIALSPHYDGEYIMLDPYAKIGSEWGALALALADAGRSDSARWALQQGRLRGGFPDITLELAHNTLASCDTGAILFTNGDNDTFPLWYLQMVERYRRDVTVVNLALTNSAWYVKALRDSYPFGEAPLPLTLTDEAIDGLTLRRITGTTMATLDVPKETMKAFGGGARGATIGFEIIGHRYGDEAFILPEDEVVLDVLRANRWRRPVTFSATIGDDDAPGLDIFKYLRCDGITYRMTPRKLDGKTRVSLTLNASLLFDSSRFQWRALQGGGDIYSINAYGWLQNYLWTFMATADGYLYNRRRADAARTLARMEELLPFERYTDLYEGVLDELKPLYEYARRMEKYEELKGMFR